MTRLFLVAGLTSAGVGAVHFVDGNHASVSFPAASSLSTETRKEGADSLSLGRIGVLRLDQYAREHQFVVSSEQSLSDRLVVSASVAPRDEAVGGDVQQGGGMWERRAKLRGGTKDGTEGGATECVKFLGDVGSWGQKREKWFPEDDDPRDLLRALDQFCPIQWLREEEEEKRKGNDGDEAMVGEAGAEEQGVRAGGGMYRGGGGHMYRGVAGMGGGAQHYNSKPRKVVIYQRDRNRRILDTDKVSNLEIYPKNRT